MQARRPRRALLLATLGFLLAAPLLAAVHDARPAPYGDRFTTHARVEHATPPRPRTETEPRPRTRTALRLRTEAATVEAYDEATGRPRWTYAREGRRPLTALPVGGHSITLWDDGLVTDAGGRGVRWHRMLPAAADRLAVHGGSGVLRALNGRMLAVVAPERIAAYRVADGDLRWVLPAHQGCSFAPTRAVRHGRALLIAQPCAAAHDWTAEIVALDDLGRITPDRTPLGNERRGEHHSPEHPHTEKVVARPR